LYTATPFIFLVFFHLYKPRISQHISLVTFHLERFCSIFLFVIFQYQQHEEMGKTSTFFLEISTNNPSSPVVFSECWGSENATPENTGVF
jgi:hypothetical protein